MGWTARRPGWIAGLLGVALALGSCGGEIPETAVSAPSHVGGATCAGCHEAEARRWAGSHHDLAMQEATPETVLGDFGGATLTHRGVTSIFFRRDGRFLVRTEGPGGAPAEYPVAYTFGVHPLQQYLVPFPGGRYQVLPLAWDTRRADQGGQRWFHLYPDADVGPGSPLHWTRPAGTWNTGCAACHSTGLRVGFDVATRSFESSWSDLDVSCEACHGPGSAHVAIARRVSASSDPPEEWGLTAPLRGSRGMWRLPPGRAVAVRAETPASREEVEVCAACHARRTAIDTGHVAGEPFLDAFEPALLREGLYHADGQIDDEVYVYGSFVQSRMYAAGVTCSDCHDPHDLEPLGEGNALCARCHAPAVFDDPTHHLHESGSSGAQCVGCHMPPTTYMQVDPRRDHAFRVPRPDLGRALGTPDACTGCHEDRSAGWAAGVLEARYGPPPDRSDLSDFALAFHGGRAGDPGAFPALAAGAADTAQPAIVRATALALLGAYARSDVADAVVAGLSDPAPLVRIGALEALEALEALPGRPAEQVLPLALPLLDDPVRAVRLKAARVLAGAPSGTSTPGPPERTDALEAAWAELAASYRADAGRSGAWVELADLFVARGMASRADSALRTALALDSMDLAARLNLADLQRATGRDDLAGETLSAALALHPQAPAVHHAIGLLRVRQGDTPGALEPLAYAAREAPGDPRFAYVHGVARASTGDVAGAMRLLEDALERHPWDADLLAALASYARELGRTADARRYAERLVEVTPDDAGARAFLDELTRW